MLPLLALAGCDWWDRLTDEAKKPIGGKREPVIASVRGLDVDSIDTPTVPPAVENENWLQFFGNTAHVGGNLAAGLTRSWSVSIGKGGDYRQRLTAQPLVSAGRIFTMDSDGELAAFDMATGHRIWRTPTRPRRERSSNIGGGIAIYQNRLYAVTGRMQVLAVDLADGGKIWEASLPTPARGAPTVTAEGIFVCTIDEQLLGLSLQNGHQMWAYAATATNIGQLGQAAPAYADGVLVAGFESGDLAAVRADSGTLVWTDNMGGIKGSEGLSDFAAVRAAPVIRDGLVLGLGLGGLLASLDLRSGRRVWQRDVAGINTPWLAGDTVYVLSIEQRLAALSWADGQVMWATNIPRFKQPKRERGLINWTGPVMAGGKLILVSDRGKMCVADPTTGTVVTSTNRIADSGSVPPTIAEGTVLILTDDATLTAYK